MTTAAKKTFIVRNKSKKTEDKEERIVGGELNE